MNQATILAECERVRGEIRDAEQRTLQLMEYLRGLQFSINSGTQSVTASEEKTDEVTAKASKAAVKAARTRKRKKARKADNDKMQQNVRRLYADVVVKCLEAHPPGTWLSSQQIRNWTVKNTDRSIQKKSIPEIRWIVENDDRVVGRHNGKGGSHSRWMLKLADAQPAIPPIPPKPLRYGYPKAALGR